MLDWTGLRQSLLPATRVSLPNLRLPMLPSAVQKFAQRSSDPDASVRELAGILESDAGLTTELLRHVNSTAMGLRRKAANPQHALSLMGVRDARLFLLTTAVRRSLKLTESKLVHVPTLWAQNVERSIFARHVARLMKADVELAFSAGMLQDFLLPVLTNELTDSYVAFLSDAGPRSVSLAEFERKTFGWTHAEAAASIMRDWGFPDDLVCCVALHHRGLSILGDAHLGRTAAAAAAIAGLMPSAIQQEPSGMDQLLKLEQAWPALRLDEAAQIVETEFQALSAERNPFPFRRALEKARAAA